MIWPERIRIDPVSSDPNNRISAVPDDRKVSKTSWPLYVSRESVDKVLREKDAEVKRYQEEMMKMAAWLDDLLTNPNR